MPYHQRLDIARENALSKEKKIGTTGRGIGPCYVDKVGRVGMKVGDLMDPVLFKDKLEAAVEEKNFVLTRQFNADPVDLAEITDQFTRFAEQLSPLSVTFPWFWIRRDDKGKISCLRALRDPTRYRSRHISLCHLLKHYCRGGLYRFRIRAEPYRRGHRHPQSLHHSRRRRTFPHRTARGGCDRRCAAAKGA